MNLLNTMDLYDLSNNIKDTKKYLVNDLVKMFQSRNRITLISSDSVKHYKIPYVGDIIINQNGNIFNIDDEIINHMNHIGDLSIESIIALHKDNIVYQTPNQIYDKIINLINQKGELILEEKYVKEFGIKYNDSIVIKKRGLLFNKYNEQLTKNLDDFDTVVLKSILNHFEV